MKKYRITFEEKLAFHRELTVSIPGSVTEDELNDILDDAEREMDRAGSPNPLYTALAKLETVITKSPTTGRDDAQYAEYAIDNLEEIEGSE